jgi:hypothetical protein
MTWRSYAVVSGATVLAGWLASAPPTGAPGTAASTRPAAAAVPDAAADIVEQASRLEARLRGDAAYVEPERNPFRFGIRRAETAPLEVVAPAPVETFAPPPAAPSVTLSGIAEDAPEGRLERTAVLSSPSGVLLVREGETVLGRYRVVRIESAAVELVELTDGGTLRLALRP